MVVVRSGTMNGLLSNEPRDKLPYQYRNGANIDPVMTAQQAATGAPLIHSRSSWCCTVDIRSVEC